MSADEIIKGWRFSASMMPWVRLTVLRRHGEVHEGAGTENLPVITENGEEGIWTPVTRTFRELGFDVDEPLPSTMSSAVGYIPLDGGTFLPFLIAIRECVEQQISATEQCACLKEVLSQAKWSEYVQMLGGEQEIIRRFGL